MLILREHKVWELYIGARVFGGDETPDYSGVSFERNLAIYAFLRQDCYDYYGEPFTEIKVILSHSGEFRASESYLMSSTQNEWTVFSYGICVRTASIFPPQLPSQNGEATPGPLSLCSLRGRRHSTGAGF